MWKDWLAFSRKEQYGIILLAVLIFIFILFRWLITLAWEPPTINIVNDPSEYVDKKQVDMGLQKKAVSSDYSDKKYQFKPFDPNNVTVTELDQMGLPSYVIVNWIKYLESGGRFFTPDDVSRVYGLNTFLAQELSHFVYFSDEKTEKGILRENHKGIEDTLSLTAFSISGFNDSSAGSGTSEFLTDTSFVIELNSATASDLKRIRGIGDVLSRRIIDFRELLGGFYSEKQVCEVYGISEELYDNINKFLVVSRSPYRKIAVNKASVRYLKSHPYLNFYQARDIVEYRKSNGTILSAQEMKQIHSIDNQTFEKIVPYLDFDVSEKIAEQKIEN